MVQRILVPLDGSQLAEGLLPAAAALCARAQGTLILLHVVEHDAPTQIHGEHHLTTREEAVAYLKSVAQRLTPTVPVEIHVHEVEVHDVPRAIAEHSVEQRCDLILMCTHGESGFRDRLVGSVAQHVITHTRTPVLLFQINRSGQAVMSGFRRFLIALDGNRQHARAMAAALELCSQLGASVHLLTVVPQVRDLPLEQEVTRRYFPSTVKHLLDFSEEEAEHYLEEEAGAAKKAGVEASLEVRRGDPAKEIVACARARSCDLIVLGTHAKVGVEGFLAGSITARILSEAPAPVLLVPIYDSGGA